MAWHGKRRTPAFMHASDTINSLVAMHARVRSGSESPVVYPALDPQPTFQASGSDITGALAVAPRLLLSQEQHRRRPVPGAVSSSRLARSWRRDRRSVRLSYTTASLHPAPCFALSALLCCSLSLSVSSSLSLSAWLARARARATRRRPHRCSDHIPPRIVSCSCREGIEGIR